MSIAPEELGLDADRIAQLRAALSTPEQPDALEQILAEAEAEVDGLTRGFDVDPIRRRGWLRAVALYRIFTLAGGAPENLAQWYQDTMTELRAIAEGRRENLARENLTPPAQGPFWGSQEKIATRL